MQHDDPLYIQVKQELEDFILSGKFALGREIPSIRAPAVDFQVNTDTVQHAGTIRLAHHNAISASFQDALIAFFGNNGLSLTFFTHMVQ